MACRRFLLHAGDVRQQRVFVSGASVFAGAAICNLLLTRAHSDVDILARPRKRGWRDDE
jgi:hypothetical protein